MNADATLYEGFLGLNLYLYCEDNPIIYVDPTGEIAIVDDLVFWGGAAIISLVFLAVASPMIVDTVEYITEGAYQLAIDAINVIDTINDMTLPYSTTNDEKITIDSSLTTEKRAGPKGKPGRKKQGREINEKKEREKFQIER